MTDVPYNASNAAPAVGYRLPTGDEAAHLRAEIAELCRRNAELEEDLAAATRHSEASARVGTQVRATLADALGIPLDAAATTTALARRAADEIRHLRATLEHVVATLAPLHTPRGPFCAECDEQGGELKSPTCPHAPRYCRTCWRNEDTREPWPCPTAKAIACDEGGFPREQRVSAARLPRIDPVPPPAGAG